MEDNYKPWFNNQHIKSAAADLVMHIKLIKRWMQHIFPTEKGHNVAEKIVILTFTKNIHTQ